MVMPELEAAGGRRVDDLLPGELVLGLAVG